jgi:hypothetical protein
MNRVYYDPLVVKSGISALKVMYEWIRLKSSESVKVNER